MAIKTPVGLHRDTNKLFDEHEVVRQLNEALGATLVAALAGVKTRQQPNDWARPDGGLPRPASWNRIQFAHQVWTALQEEEGRDVARRWFIGGNPLLGESTPIMAIGDDRHAEVRRAARAFVDGDVDE